MSTTNLRPFPPILRFPIRGLAQGTHHVHLEAPVDELEMGPYFGKISATGEVRVFHYLHFLLHLSGMAELTCDRCARQFMRQIETNVDVFFEQDQTDSHHDHEEVFLFDPQWPEIDLTEVIRDHLILALPMKNLCSEACEGLATAAWEPEETQNKAVLRALYDKLRSEEMNDEPK